jgi:hypothetical protein
MVRRSHAATAASRIRLWLASGCLASLAHLSLQTPPRCVHGLAQGTVVSRALYPCSDATRLFECRRPYKGGGSARASSSACARYSATMLVEESRVFQVATFSTLHLHQSELDQNQVLLDVMVIADEVDAQLMETVRSLMEVKAEAVA